VKVVIFTGPTLSAAEASAALSADYRPPAAEGDIYRAACRHPQAIGIIDGYFERVPSVRHKEILWAMSRGIHVFGAASMGALRAAELAPFGMEGVGVIFEAYRDGRLEDDDEVAVAHGGAEFGYRAGSEAMVDIRHTLGCATAAGIISTDARDLIEAAAKAIFYPGRNYPSIMVRAAQMGLPPSELNAFRRWLPSGRSSLKRTDALAMLYAIRDRVAAGIEPKRVRYWFENSSMWESSWRLAGDSDDPGTAPMSAVIEELRLDSAQLQRTQEAALLRVLAVKQSYVQGMAEAGAQRGFAARRFWSDRQVTDDASRNAWMSANHVDEQQLTALLDDEARVAWIKSIGAFDASTYLLDQLRVSGDYPRLVARALSKQSVLAESGLEDANTADTGLDESDLLRWFFVERLGTAVPADLDAYRAEMGYANRADFARSVAREYCFVKGRPVKAGIEG